MDKALIKNYLETKGKYIHHRESQTLEFKEQFNLAGLADYFHDFAGFANNKGGFIIFGVKDSPRLALGLNENSLEQFYKIDPEKISGYLLEIFSPNIDWEQEVIEHLGKKFGVFYIKEANVKPIISKKDEGKGPIIKNGEIYFRYGGRTQKIQYSELENIISDRIDKNEKKWMNLISNISKIGVSNVAILDTENGIIENDKNNILMLDDELVNKIKFIREGEFDEVKGTTTLKLVGNVVPIKRIDVVKKVHESITKAYPYSGLELSDKIKEKFPNVGQNRIWEVIKDRDLKSNSDYSVYNFRNRKQEEDYNKNGKIAKNTPSIYNQKAIDYLINIFENKI